MRSIIGVPTRRRSRPAAGLLAVGLLLAAGCTGSVERAPAVDGSAALMDSGDAEDGTAARDGAAADGPAARDGAGADRPATQDGAAADRPAAVDGPAPAVDARVAQCGDTICDPSESCAACPQDCGVCPPVCGDTRCEAPESCSTCPADCGGCSSCGNGTCETGETCQSCPADCGGTAIPADFSGVVWLHTNVSSWARTATLSSVTIGASQTCLNYDKASVWQGVDHVGAFVNANPWIFVYQSGTWYAATWEWLRVGQTCKNTSSVAGDHIKQNPLTGFQPRSGACYGFMVSGLARDATRNVLERSQVVMATWP